MISSFVKDIVTIHLLICVGCALVMYSVRMFGSKQCNANGWRMTPVNPLACTLAVIVIGLVPLLNISCVCGCLAELFVKNKESEDKS